MKKIILIFLFLIPPLFAKETVLLTAFEPFGGSPVNRSREVAEAVQKILQEKPDAEIDIRVCILPVVYDKAALVAQECFEKDNPKPTRVISLGEAGDCTVRLETAAHNLDHTPGFPDNEKQERSNHTILPDQPPSLGFNLPVQEMYCSVSLEKRHRLSVSESPGGFVCNNTAFHLAHFFKGKPIQFGFAHVPASRCGLESDPQANGLLIAQMLEGLSRFDREKICANYPMPHCSNENRLPISLKELEEIMKYLKFGDRRDCTFEFLNKLRLRLPARVVEIR